MKSPYKVPESANHFNNAKINLNEDLSVVDI